MFPFVIIALLSCNDPLFAHWNSIKFAARLLSRLPQKSSDLSVFYKRAPVLRQYIGQPHNFQKFFAMLAGAQNFGSDAGNLVSS
jgi:hypothetical protein